jgi:metal-sulfur cluster biosynthetic enzyme
MTEPASQSLPPEPDSNASEAPSLKADEATILNALKTVKDPEVGVNIVDLGLVYTIATREGEVDVEMTLTTPACPAGPEILRNAVSAIEAIEGINKANVKLVMTPPWSPDRMSDDARDEMGIF